MNNWQERRANTVPTNALSVLKMASVANGPTGLTVTWQSVLGRVYYLQRTTDFSSPNPFRTIATNLTGVGASQTSFTDTTVTNAGPFFYRVGVR